MSKYQAAQRSRLLLAQLPCLLVALAACRPTPPPPGLRVSVVGDVLLARSVPAALAHDSTGLRGRVRPWWGGSRYVVANLECPLTDTARPVRKPLVFQGLPRWAGWLRTLGVTHVSLANNHSLDQQLPGLRATARAARVAGLRPLGYQPDSLAGCLPTVLGADSSVAVFAWSALGVGGAGAGCVCGRPVAALAERVAAYKTLFPERAVLVYLHWGREYAAGPDDEQRRQAHDLLDAGAAAVVGAHPHVVQPVEFYRGRPIVYSLGNFLFDQRGGATALAAQVDFDLAGGRVVATTLRPWQLLGAVPYPADTAARTTLARRLRPADGSAQLVTLAAAADGWLACPTAPFQPADSLAAYLVPHLALPGPGNRRTEVRLRYLPTLRRYQALAYTGAAETRLPLSGRVYRFAAGDVDGDGWPELLVGPVRATPLDAAVRRRLFVYRVDSAGRLQPLWRGSRLLRELVYFGTGRERGRSYVFTIEREPGGYCVAQYQWQNFGLVLSRFRARGLGRATAYRAFVRVAR